MFISDDDSNHGIQNEEGKNSTFDEIMGYRYDLGEDFKSELELSNDSKPVLSTLEPGYVSAGKLPKKLMDPRYLFITIIKLWICFRWHKT